MAFFEVLYGSLESSFSIFGVCAEMMVILGSLWIAFLAGLMVGWSWKPKWVTLESDKLTCSVSKILDSSLPSSPCRSLMSPLKNFGSLSQWNSFLVRSSNGYPHWAVDNNNSMEQNLSPVPLPVPPTEFEDCSSRSQPNEEQSDIARLVTEEDLKHLYQLVDVKDGGPSWLDVMDRSTPTMRCQAWRRDMKNGPPQYCSSTIFEDASPEIVRDFFWDDEFRPKWDDMQVYSAIVDECPTTGALLVHWIRKFPFFCSDREYIIGRRMWESGRSYYCVTKGVPCSSIPRRDKPRRVDLYYSSWFIRAAKSRKGDGQLTACEVVLFHYEDMGIPWEIAKLGVWQGMWGTVKKIEPGLRAYQKARASEAALSRHAFMARINTKVHPDLFRSLGDNDDLPETEVATPPDKPFHRNIPKLLIFGGAVVLACSFDRGLLTKAFIFSVGRIFGNMGKNAKLNAANN